MPKTGCSLGLPKGTRSTCLKTSKVLSGLGRSADCFSSQKKSRNGMSTAYLALLDRIIPITNGGQPTLKKRTTVPLWILDITIILWCVLAVTCLKTMKERFSKFTMLHRPRWNTGMKNIINAWSDKKFDAIWTILWLSSLISSMQQWEHCKQNADMIVLKPNYDWANMDFVLPDPALDTPNYIEECIYDKRRCPRCQIRGNPYPFECDMVYHVGSDSWVD